MSDKFFLAPTVVAAKKYIDISRDEIERTLNDENGEFDYDWEETVTDELNTEHVVTLKLNINCKAPLMISWSIARSCIKSELTVSTGTAPTATRMATSNMDGIGTGSIRESNPLIANVGQRTRLNDRPTERIFSSER